MGPGCVKSNSSARLFAVASRTVSGSKPQRHSIMRSTEVWSYTTCEVCPRRANGETPEAREGSGRVHLLSFYRLAVLSSKGRFVAVVEGMVISPSGVRRQGGSTYGNQFPPRRGSSPQGCQGA